MKTPNKNYPTKIYYFLILTFTLSALSAAAQTNLPCTPPPAGMVAWFTGDGNAVDIQGANNGILQNGATFTTAANGRVQEAFTFDGSNDFVEVPDLPSLRLNNPVTIEAWVKPAGFGASNRIVDKSTVGQGDGYLLDLVNGKLRLLVGSNPNDGIGSSNQTLPLNQWTHVAGTYDGANIRLYINGVLDHTIATANLVTTNNLPLRIGANSNGGDLFNGQMDEVELFNRALAPHEIRAIYNSGANGKCKPISNQILLVANLALHSVRKYDADTLAYLGDLVAPGSGGLVDPFGLAFDGANTLYVSDYINDRVRRYDIRTGDYLGDLDPANAGGLDMPVGITFGPDGKLYVAEQGTSRVLRYNFTTNAYEIFVSTPTGLFLSDVAFGPDSTGDTVPELYATDLGFPQGNPGGVRRYNGATGAFIDYFVPLGSGGLQGAYYLQFHSDGFLYVSDLYNHNVKRYNATTGAFVDIFTGTTGDPAARFFGLTFGANGNLFVSHTTASLGAEIFEMSGSNGSLISATAQMANNPTDLLFIPALCTAAPAGLAAFYTADGTSEDSVGTNEGTMQNGAFYAAGKSGSAAFSFDGVDDYVQVPHNANIDFGANQNFTIEAWIKVNSSDITDAYGSIVIKHDGTNSAGYLLYVQQNGNIGFDISDGVPYYELTGGNVANGGWRHVVGQRDGAVIRIFVDGQLTGSMSATAGSLLNNDPLTIGDYFDLPGSGNFKGQIDEVSIYNTALSGGDIADIFKTGKGGKCRPANQCTLPPAQMTGWYRGEGNADDTLGTNNGTSNGTYAAGKVGQAFSFDGSSQFVNVPDSPTFNTTSLTLDAWVNTDTLTGPDTYRSIITKYDSALGTTGVSYYLLMLDGGRLSFGAIQNNTTYRAADTNSQALTIGVWQHVAGVFDYQTQELSIYVNGIKAPATLAATAPKIRIADSGAPVRLGMLRDVSGNSRGFWDGLIDEAEIFNRALSQTEIQALYNAGSAGKCFLPEISLTVTNTPAYQNSNFDFTATVNNHGAATANGVVLNTTLPANLNFVSADAGCVYNPASRRVTCTIGNIAANLLEKSSVFAPAASVSRNIVVQPITPGALQMDFTATANEADAVVANNLFAANVNVFAPTAAGVSIGGRITTADGRGNQKRIRYADRRRRLAAHGFEQHVRLLPLR